MTTLDTLRSIFADVVSDEGEIDRETSAADVPDWDSLSHVRLILAIERKFKVKFSAAEVAKLKTVGDLVDLIDAKSSR